MTTYVLVPGFWLGAWAWEDVTERLRAAGHEVHPVTLTGQADRAAEATPDVGVETHIADVIAVLETHDLREVVLVAHSGGATPVTGAADRIPERIARIVYVDTGPLPDGMAQIEFNPPEVQAAIEKRVADEGDGWKIPVPAFDPAEDPENLAGLTEGHLRAMRERGTPQPFGTASEPLRRPEVIPGTPRTLISCTFTLEQVKRLAASGNPVFASMAGPEWTYHALPTGHWPMFSRPADLAALLSGDGGDAVAGDRGASRAGGAVGGHPPVEQVGVDGPLDARVAGVVAL
jgi:pimeloyl-ACP methyl ester carboxylesterase